MHPNTHRCTFCGINLLGMKRRLFCPTEGRAFIEKRCKATPFLHAHLLASLLSASGRQVLCIPCVNWKRRAERGTLRRQAVPMLQLDQLLLFLMQPGKHQEPDLRCMERLIKAVRQPENPYRQPFVVCLACRVLPAERLEWPGKFSRCRRRRSSGWRVETRTWTARSRGGSTTDRRSFLPARRRPGG